MARKSIKACAGCGCTDDRACEGGCSWSIIHPEERYCSACLPLPHNISLADRVEHGYEIALQGVATIMGWA